ncbi:MULTISPECIES: MFS transporter [Arthrobacter]|uniref:MFS transporter n=2 Tax=Arthrobacter TaxID=1663 RepID=A0ABU9KJL7_9MICC|nr:MFS transporter [Arthrobacter sp. YJM1]MDP5226729.1 MFS transporter [Arthrobacter sp. YJM1]
MTTTNIAATKPRGFFSRIGNKQSWIAMGLLWGLFAMNGNMRSWAIGSLQPAIVKEFNVDPTTIGLFAGFVTLAQGLFAIPIAHWSDKGGAGWRRKYRYIAVVLAYVVLTILTGVNIFTVSLLAVFILQFLQKVFSGAGEALEVTNVTEWWPVEKRGFAQGLHHTSYPWGTFIGGLIIAGMLSAFGQDQWRMVFLILPLISLPLLMMFWKFSSKKNYDKFTADTLARGQTVPVGHGGADKVPAGALKRALKNPNVMITSLIMGLALAVYTGISFWLPLYLAFVANFNLADTAALSVVFTITGGVGQILWGSVSDKLGRKLTLIVLFIWLAIALVLMQYIGLGIIALVGLQLLLGLATNGVYPVLYAMAADSIEPGAVGLAMGFNVAGQMIAAIGPIAVGAFIAAGGGFHDASGYMVGLYVMAAAMLLCAVLMFLFTRETIGWFRKRDRALVSETSCLQGPLHAGAES